MTAKEESFVNACRQTNLSDENRAQWERYCHLTSGARTEYAEAVIDKWNRILGGSEFASERESGAVPKDWHKLIPRGEPHPLAGKPADGGNRKGVGKVKMNLVMHDMAEALYEVCKVMTEGAKKHEPKGWVKVPNGIYEYTEALHRHLNAESRGELRDKEWQLLHAAHAACCALIRTQLIINELKAKQALPEGTTFENGFAMVPNNPLRFKLTPEGCPPGTTITVKRPIGGSAEQAGPLSDFTPMNPDPSVDTGVRPATAEEPLRWESFPQPKKECAIKMYTVENYEFLEGKTVRFRVRHDNGMLITFDVKDAWTLMELGPVSQLANMIYRTKISDADIAGWAHLRPDGQPVKSDDTGAKPLSQRLGSYMTLSGEVTPWENLMRDGSCVIKRYEAKHCYTRGNQVLLTCIDHGVDGKQYSLVSLSVDWTREDVRKRVEDPISFFSALVGEKLSDRDFAIFTGRIK